jgi:hypothetical protein
MTSHKNDALTTASLPWACQWQWVRCPEPSSGRAKTEPRGPYPGPVPRPASPCPAGRPNLPVTPSEWQRVPQRGWPWPPLAAPARRPLAGVDSGTGTARG